MNADLAHDLGPDRRTPEARVLPRWSSILAFAALLTFQAAFLLRQQTPFLEDDAAFFLRYAENIAAGHGWRWNVEEPPIWGASAPLWPLPIALGLRLGLSPLTAVLVASWFFALSATALLGAVAHRLHGALGVLALTPLLVVNHLYSTWATSGMESPMTFSIVALALLAASGAGGAVLLGVAAGACMVHKLDLAPLGLALLVATAIWRREHLRTAVLVAFGIVAAWYGFAAWHFGGPIPNSFLRKLGSDYGDLSHAWFVQSALTAGGGIVRLPLAMLGWVTLRRRPMLAAVTGGGILAPCLGYSLRPPSEPFMWYAAAIAPIVAFLAALGLAWLLRRTDRVRNEGVAFAAAVVPVALLAWPLAALESPRTREWHAYLRNIEPPFIQAGQWVDQNLPTDARLMSAWGHPSLASRRFVYDASFLNRRPEEGSLLLKYTPEAWIHSFFGPFEEFEIPSRYRLARSFSPASPDYSSFHVLVLVRADLRLPGEPESVVRPRAGAKSGRRKQLARLRAAGTLEGLALSPDEHHQLLTGLQAAQRRLARLPEDQRAQELRAKPWMANLPAWIADLRARAVDPPGSP